MLVTVVALALFALAGLIFYGAIATMVIDGYDPFLGLIGMIPFAIGCWLTNVNTAEGNDHQSNLVMWGLLLGFALGDSITVYVYFKSPASTA